MGGSSGDLHLSDRGYDCRVNTELPRVGGVFLMADRGPRDLFEELLFAG